MFNSHIWSPSRSRGFITRPDWGKAEHAVSHDLVSWVCVAEALEPVFKESGQAALSCWLIIIESGLCVIKIYSLYSRECLPTRYGHYPFIIVYVYNELRTIVSKLGGTGTGVYWDTAVCTLIAWKTFWYKYFPCIWIKHFITFNHLWVSQNHCHPGSDVHLLKR